MVILPDLGTRITQQLSKDIEKKKLLIASSGEKPTNLRQKYCTQSTHPVSQILVQGDLLDSMGLFLKGRGKVFKPKSVTVCSSPCDTDNYNCPYVQALTCN